MAPEWAKLLPQSGELFATVGAAVGLLSGVDTHVHLEGGHLGFVT